MFVLGSFIAVGFVAVYYEDLVVKFGLVDPQKLRNRKPADNNPLPLELRDEYVSRL